MSDVRVFLNGLRSNTLSQPQGNQQVSRMLRGVYFVDDDSLIRSHGNARFGKTTVFSGQLDTGLIYKESILT
jgi:hypothetical protein